MCTATLAQQELISLSLESPSIVSVLSLHCTGSQFKDGGIVSLNLTLGGEGREKGGRGREGEGEGRERGREKGRGREGEGEREGEGSTKRGISFHFENKISQTQRYHLSGVYCSYQIIDKNAFIMACLDCRYQPTFIMACLDCR